MGGKWVRPYLKFVSLNGVTAQSRSLSFKGLLDFESTILNQCEYDVATICFIVKMFESIVRQSS